MELQAMMTAVAKAATSPLALMAYVVAVIAWTLKIWLAGKPERDAQRLLKLFKTDASRNEALSILLGQQIPKNLPPAEILAWVRLNAQSKSRSLLVISYGFTLLAAIITIGIASYTYSKRGLNESPPVLIDSTVIKQGG